MRSAWRSCACADSRRYMTLKPEESCAQEYILSRKVPNFDVKPMHLIVRFSCSFSDLYKIPRAKLASSAENQSFRSFSENLYNSIFLSSVTNRRGNESFLHR
jgi:hypothetical protein